MEFLKELSAVSPLPHLKLNRPLIDRTKKGDIGIEIELEGSLYAGEALFKYKAEHTGASWITHRDDSLRNGIEYVLSQPCSETEVDPLVRYLYTTLEEQGSRITLSNRTSTHVHINVQGLKPSELTSFICLWGLFEQAAVNYSGILRKANQFCLTTKDTNGWLPTVWRESLESGRFAWDNGVKYSALNLAAFSNFGSFEFRTMKGCCNPEHVISWARFLVRLRDVAMAYLPDEIGRGVSEKTPTGFLREVCGNDLETFSTAFQDATPAFDDVCLDSFRDYQELAFFVPWGNLRDQINRREIRRPFDEDNPKVKRRRPLTNEVIPARLQNPTATVMRRGNFEQALPQTQPMAMLVPQEAPQFPIELTHTQEQLRINIEQIQARLDVETAARFFDEAWVFDVMNDPAPPIQPVRE